MFYILYLLTSHVHYIKPGLFLHTIKIHPKHHVGPRKAYPHAFNFPMANFNYRIYHDGTIESKVYMLQMCFGTIIMRERKLSQMESRKEIELKKEIRMA